MSEALIKENENCKLQVRLVNANVQACKQIINEQTETMTVLRTNFVLVQQHSAELQAKIAELQNQNAGLLAQLDAIVKAELAKKAQRIKKATSKKATAPKAESAEKPVEKPAEEVVPEVEQDAEEDQDLAA